MDLDGGKDIVWRHSFAVSYFFVAHFWGRSWEIFFQRKYFIELQKLQR
jgi:hypothetical protein